MSTNTVKEPGRVKSISKKLYQGENLRGEPIGSLLERISRQGREIPKQEKPRWDVNRAFFRGDQHMHVNPDNNSIRALSRQMTGTGSSKYNTFNRLRQFTEGRVAMMASEKPSYKVEAPDSDKESIDAAKLATKFVSAMWDQEGWSVQSNFSKLILTGEIDGISWLYVNWNRFKGVREPVPHLLQEGAMYVLQTGQDEQKAIIEEMGPEGPIVDRKLYEFLREADPEGQTYWHTRYERLGDVEFRVVRPGSLACDPFATDFEKCKWICEATIISRQDAEQMATKPLAKLLEENKKLAEGDRLSSAVGESTPSTPDVNTDDGDPKNRTLPGRDALLAYRMFHLPNKDFPLGAHCFWLDVAPHVPLILEPYDDDELPYKPFTPKPDHGHFMRSRGTVDDLLPMQMYFNRTLTMLEDYLVRVGKPNVAMPRGSIVGNSIYNEDGYFEFHPGVGPPVPFQTPSEPTSVLTHHLSWIEQQMGEVSAQSASARGQTNQYSPEAAVGIQQLIQQTELQLSGTEAIAKTLLEWGVSRALRLVGDHYTKPRLVQQPGVDSAPELKAFQGEMLRGATRFRIDGSLMPHSKAQQWQAMLQFIPMLGPEARPWIADFVGGDIEEFKSQDKANKDYQKGENQRIAAIASNQKAKKVYEDFQEQVQKYLEAQQMMQSMLQQQGMPMGEPGSPNGQSPLDNAGMAMQRMNMPPPNFTEMLIRAGVPVPVVEDFHDHDAHTIELNAWRVSDAWDYHPELVRQLAREHGEKHLEFKARNMMQLGAAMGGGMPPPGAGPPGGGGGGGKASPPAEKGEPSQPKQSGGPSKPPAGAAPPAMTGGKT